MNSPLCPYPRGPHSLDSTQPFCNPPYLGIKLCECSNRRLNTRLADFVLHLLGPTAKRATMAYGPEQSHRLGSATFTVAAS
eukprot:3123942-Amphidinium_carterae.1